MPSKDNAVRKLHRRLGPPEKDSVLVLTPWQAAYCEWYASRPTQVGQRTRHTRCKQFLAEHCEAIAEPMPKFSLRDMRNLEASHAFQRYFKDLQKDYISAARASFIKDLPRYIELHRKGAEMALKANDHRALPAYTVPALDRAMPRKDQVMPITNVSISISPERIAALASEATPEIDYEVVSEPNAQL